MTPATHADDRGLVLLFHAGGQTILWAGRIGLEIQHELLAAYPDLRADVLVMGTEPPPDAAWLQSLEVPRLASRFRPAIVSPIPPTPPRFPISARSGNSTRPAPSIFISNPRRATILPKSISARGSRCLQRPDFFYSSFFPRAASRIRYQLLRSSSISSAFVASLIASGRVEPRIGMILLGCRISHANTTAKGVVL